MSGFLSADICDTRDTVLTGIAFGSDSPQFNAHGMLTLLKVGQRMAIPTHTSILLTPAAQRTTGKAEPKILLEIALRAVCQSYGTTLKLSMGMK